MAQSLKSCRAQVAALLLLLSLPAIHGGCKPVDTESAEIRSNPLSPPLGADTDKMRFRRLTPAESGVQFINPIDTDHPLERLYIGSFACGGVALADADRDGRLDIFLTSGPRENRLYRQHGPLKFTDVTAQAGLAGGSNWSAGAAWVDVDADGDLDLYVSQYDQPNHLYINDTKAGGHISFHQAAAAWDLDISDASLMPYFSDYDLDGDLDLFLLTYDFKREGGLPEKMPTYWRGGKWYLEPGFEKYYEIQLQPETGQYIYINAPRRNRFFENQLSQGQAHFVETTDEAGISGRTWGNSAVWWDFNDDGWPDLYVANDLKSPDQLYVNQHDGTFVDVIADTVHHTTWTSMGSDVADLNGDGRLDLLVADMAATTHFKQKTTMGNMDRDQQFLLTGEPRQTMRNALFLGTGTGRLLEAAHLAGLAKTDWTWSINLRDFDNDGRVDAFMTNGIPRNINDSDATPLEGLPIGLTEWDRWKSTPVRREQNRAYCNHGNLDFEDVSSAWGLDHTGVSYAAAAGDLDGDGDVDLVVANADEPVGIYINGAEALAHHRVRIQLRGRTNRFGIGAVVRVEAGGKSQVQVMNPYTGFLSSNEPILHFGLGKAERIDRVTVDWPGGPRQQLTDLEADRTYTLRQPEGPEQQNNEPARPAPLYTRVDLGMIRHRERSFDDYAQQPLLPGKLSQLGPGLAVGDVDGDGDEDFYIGGAAGSAGQLYLKDQQRFERGYADDFFRDRHHEDMGALFLDVNGDGDLDLYVVSGGVEYPPDHELLGDRLYLNDGEGQFTKAQEHLPAVHDSGSSVVAADFDRDGDLDLFVGGRVIPGQYPLAAHSRLLVNDGSGKFTDQTDGLAPNLGRSGLVTAALFSDADGDGWVDLLVTNEWGPVKLFRNQEGRFVEVTREAGLAELTGWWNGIAASDIDHDGDMDYAVTNLGFNTKYHASAESPALLYYGDFEGNGVMRLVEGEFEDQTLYPIRGRSCLSHAMPFVAKKYDTFKGFADASLEEICSTKNIASAHRFAAVTLASGILVNDGAGVFNFKPLPRLVQISPGFGVAFTEIDGDGHADLYLVQNFFHPQPETGRMDGGLSLMLRGDGAGGFSPVPPAESGLIVAGDAKSLAVTDLNGDGWADFLVAVNDDKLVALAHGGSKDNRPLRVSLKGRRGNPSAAGAKVTVHLEDGPTQTAEVHCGSGYLSQSTSALTFGLGKQARIAHIDVRWPDGTQERYTDLDAAAEIVIER